MMNKIIKMSTKLCLLPLLLCGCSNIKSPNESENETDDSEELIDDSAGGKIYYEVIYNSFSKKWDAILPCPLGTDVKIEDSSYLINAMAFKYVNNNLYCYRVFKKMVLFPKKQTHPIFIIYFHIH